MKKCSRCKEHKNKSEFHKNKSRKDGLHPTCKECVSIIAINYSHTKKGIATSIFRCQRSNSKQRNRQLPPYTKQDLKDWLYAQVDFHRLFHLWEVSGYDRWLKPSVDRIEDDEPYNMGNIQLMTWGENFKKGIYNKKKPVTQYTLDGEFVATYESTIEAERQTGISDGSIGDCAKGKSRNSHAGGFRWNFETKCYKNEIDAARGADKWILANDDGKNRPLNSKEFPEVANVRT